MLNKLSQQDRDMLKTWIHYYGLSHRENNAFPHWHEAPLDHILRYWDDNKRKHLNQLFGGELILEKEICYERPENLIYREVSRALSVGDMQRFKSALMDCAERKYGYFHDTGRAIRRLLDTDYIAKNRYGGCTFEIVLDDQTTIKVPYGAKMMKVFNKLAKYFGLEELFEKFRIEHSMILNQKLIKGTLCLSIHPLDYLTMSDNTYDWDSCMSWESCGCYRTGTVEMMNSPYVIVAYLKGDRPFRIDRYNWEGNKKWRELYVVHPHAICNIKAYPYRCDEISMIVLEWLRELAAVNLGWDVSYKALNFSDGGSFDYYDNREYSIWFETDRMYNDFDTDDTYHMAIIPQGWQEEGVSMIRISDCISGENVCMCCGNRHWPDEGCEDQVLCNECDPGCRCSVCNSAWDEDDMYWVNGEYVCPDCYHDNCEQCSISGERYFSDDMVDLYLTAVDDDLSHIDYLEHVRVNERFVRTGALEYGRFFNIDTVRSTRVGYEDIYYVNIDDCSKRCLSDVFGMLWSDSLEIYIQEYIENCRDEDSDS